MKKSLLVSLSSLFTFQRFSQLLSWIPAFIQEASTPLVITVDASKGNQGLLNYKPGANAPVVKIAARGRFAEVNPNPFKEKLQLNIQSLSRERAILILTDLSGRQLFKQTKILTPGNNRVESDVAGRFAKSN